MKKCSGSQENTVLKKAKFVILYSKENSFTCEYCFSHYVTVVFLFLTGYKLLAEDWRGYILAGFSLVWIANVYMSLFSFLRQNIKKEKTEIECMENEKVINKSPETEW